MCLHWSAGEILLLLRIQEIEKHTVVDKKIDAWVEVLKHSSELFSLQQLWSLLSLSLFPLSLSLYIYIYMGPTAYIYICCEVISGAKFGLFRDDLRGQVISGAKLTLVHYSGFRRFFAHSVIILCFLFWPVIRQFSKTSLFQKRVQKLGFSSFCVLGWISEKSRFFDFAKTL